MLKKIKEKLSNLNCPTVGYFILWVGIIVTFIGLCIDAFYTLGPVTGSVFLGVTLMLVGAIFMVP